MNHSVPHERLLPNANPNPHPAPAGTRDSRAVLLLDGGDDVTPGGGGGVGSDQAGWVTHREGGVLFSLDVTRCMFSSGGEMGRGV